MRLLAPLMLLGLLALTAQPVDALCADDGNGGCSALRHDVHVEVLPCDDGTANLCLVFPDDVDHQVIPSGGILNLTVKNGLDAVLDLELFVTGRFSDAEASDGSAERVPAERILLLEDLQPGASRTVEVQVPGDASHLRLQALSADGRHGEHDAEVTPIMLMTGVGDPEPATDGGNVTDAPEEQQGNLAEKENSPFVPALLAVALLGIMAVLVRMGRDE